MRATQGHVNAEGRLPAALESGLRLMCSDDQGNPRAEGKPEEVLPSEDTRYVEVESGLLRLSTGLLDQRRLPDNNGDVDPPDAT